MGENEDVLVTVDRGIGLISLNRPKAINSLTHPMVSAISQVLTKWRDDDDIRAVVLSGEGERGLCAGGDIVAVYNSARGDQSLNRTFWWDEYLMNGYIARYPKPYISLMDGIVMGGGVGVSAHGSHRVVTDTTKMAMPEVGIESIPDVGGTYILSRAPGLLGLHAALTGAPFGGGRDRHGLRRSLRPPRGARRLQNAIVADGIDAALAAPEKNPRRATCWLNDSGSTSATPATPSRTSSPRCAATTRARPPVELAAPPPSTQPT